MMINSNVMHNSYSKHLLMIVIQVGALHGYKLASKLYRLLGRALHSSWQKESATLIGK